MGNNLSFIGVNPALYWNESIHFGDTRDEQMEAIGDEQDREIIKRNRNTGVRIRHLIREGRTREQIFSQMCQELGLLEVGAGRVNDYFRMADEDFSLLDNLLEDYYELVLKVLEEFGKCRSLICSWMEVDDTYRFLNSRYGVRANVYSKKRERITLSDNYHGQERPIPIDYPLADVAEIEIFKIEVIDFEWLFLIETISTTNFNIYLAYLDFNNLKCRILTHQHVEGTFVEIVFDSTDRHKFLLVTKANGNRYVCFGHVEERRIILEQSNIRFGKPNLLFQRLIDNRLRGMLFNEDESNEENWTGKLEFGEFILNENFPPFRRLFDIQSAVDFHKIEEYECRWVGDICYIACYVHGKGTIAIFDLNSSTLTTTLHTFYSDGQIVEIYFDKDEAFSLCIWNGLDDTREIHRFCLRQPENLFNSVLFKLRKDSIFYDGDLYNQLLVYLPPYLQPMAILNSSAWPVHLEVPILIPIISSKPFSLSRFLILVISKKD